MTCLFSVRSKLLLGGLLHFLMEKVIDYHGRLPESCAMLIVVTQIGHSRAGSEFAHFLVQLAPVRPIPLGIDGVVQVIQLRVIGKALHKRGVPILAGVGAAHKGVHGIVRYRQIGFGHHALDLDFLIFIVLSLSQPVPYRYCPSFPWL